MTAQLSIFSRPSHHAALLANSQRLKDVMAVLSDGDWHTTWEIIERARVSNPGGCISELKHPKNGIKIETDDTGLNANGRRVFRYRLVK